jgi:peptidylprolyl isomerase
MPGKAAADGDAVRVFYRGTLDDGEEFDTNRGGEPLAFTVGAGDVIAGFEEAVRGMCAGERKVFSIAADRAYGARDEDMVMELERSRLPEGELTPGLTVQFTLDDGEEVEGVLVRVEKESVTVDFNHPLAGKALTFEIEVVSVR